MDVRGVEQELIQTRCFHYIRVGYDRRRMEFLPRNRIGGGHDRLERTWHLREEEGQAVLYLVGEEGITAKLTRQADGAWHGHWLVYERMPVQLVLATGDADEQPLQALAPPEPIDAVYLWVDGSDPSFQRSLRHVSSARGILPGDERLAVRRFRDISELRYSLRSLEVNAPWIRHVYIVTNGQVPAWLNRGEPKVSVVTHDALFPDRRHLPTFNSHAIELHLHRIPGLSRYFLYLNDDVFFGRPISPADFLTSAGVQKVYLEGWNLPTDLNAGPAHDQAYAFTQSLLNRVVPPRPVRPAIAHTPQVYNRDLAEEVQGIWRREVEVTSSHPCRNPRDVAFRILYYHYALESNKHGASHSAVTIHSSSSDYAFVRLDYNVPRLLDRFDEMIFQKPKFLCLNDDLDDSEEAEIALSQCRAFFEEYFPSPSKFELGD